MQVFLARNCGFCSGVKKAVDTALSVPPENTYVLGELIHNEVVVRRISERGLITVGSLTEVKDGATLLIRSHGVGREIYAECERRNIKIVDCTCPFVRRTQEIVSRASRAGKTVAVAGHAEHPEVQGLVGWCEGNSFVFSSENDDFSALDGKEVVLVSQTTFSEQRFSKIAQNIQKGAPKTVEIFGTICYTTVCRQREAAKIAGLCDAVLVIGGLNSSNTNKLCEIASANCDRVIRLKNADDFEYEQIKFCKRVGVIAGASTPDWQTQEVLCNMEENNAEVQVTEVDSADETQATPVEETVAVALEEPKAAPAEETKVEETKPEEASPAAAPEKSFMERTLAEMNQSKKYRKNQLLSVKIVSATDEGIIVSGSEKTDITIAKEDLDCEEYSKAAYSAKVGEEIEVMVVETTPKVKLSQKLAKKVKEEEALLEDIEAGKEFSVVCTGYNKGGLTAELGTYPVFVPAKEIRIGYAKDLERYTGKKLRLKLIEIRKERRKEIIASQRVILEAEQQARDAAKAEKEAAFFENIEVGQIVEGKVERVTSFGAFVSVNGFDCLAHISDLSWTGVKAVTDVLEIGKHYEFKVLKVDHNNKKVSIGYKQLQPQPWDLAYEKYQEGDVVHGKVVRIVPFGAFVELEKGIDGLVHVSQISHEWLENPTSVLSIGEEVDAKILAFNPDEHKITLSIKALQPRPEEPVYEPREREEGNTGRQPKGRKGGRRNVVDAEEDEYREWTEGGFGGVSIADLLKGDEEK